MTLEALERQVQLLKLYAFISTVVFLGVVLTVSVQGQATKQRFTEIDVERINIIEPSGSPAIVIANSQRMTRFIHEGKESPADVAQSREAAGMIFVDATGEEVGGLLFGEWKKPDGGYFATRSFTFDQRTQDQVLGIQYVDDNGTNRVYGISLWDRPSEVTIAEMLEATKGAKDQQTRRERVANLLKSRGVTKPAEARRVFLGSFDSIPSLRLSDSTGQERVRLLVDDKNTPHLEFLDTAGKVIYSLPPK